MNDEKIRDVSLEEIFDLGEKYNMEISEMVSLKKTIIVGLIALQKCIELGLQNEIEEDIEKEFNNMEV